VKRAAVTACLLALVVATSSGCAKLREKLGKKGPAESDSPSAQGTAGASADAAAPSSSADASRGASATASRGTSASTTLPDGWPKGVPPYPGSTVQSAMTSAAGQSVILRTRDSATRVREYYMDRLGGMKLQTDLTLPSPQGASMIMVFKDTASLVTVSIAPLPGRETSLTLAIAPR
jgi:hypothetical protein